MRLLKLSCIVVVVLVLASCSTFRTKNELSTLPVEQLYEVAHTSLVQGNYHSAEDAFTRLIARFPSGKYNQQAQIELAYTQFKDNHPDEAYATISRFITTYPASKDAPYAYYLRGLINFSREGTFTQRLFHLDSNARHDQQYRLRSFADFNQLARRFPNSKYTPDARQRMIYLRNQMAQFEINVAEYYLRTKAYVAAAHRAKYVIEHYQQAPQVADALAIETRSYLALGLDKLADKSRAVLKLNYPNHPYLSDPKWPHSASTLRRMIPFSGHH